MSQPDQSDLEVRRTLILVLILNLAVAAAKLIVGGISRSISMVADGFHSLTDTASNVVGLIGIAVATKPPDEDHPYGHRKFETLAALLIGGLLAATAWQVLESCFDRLRTGTEPEVSRLSFGVMGVTIVVNLAVAFFEKQRGKRLQSQVLTADAEHTRSDVLSSLAVVASLVATRLGFPQLDVIAALLITCVIAWAAFKILRQEGMLLADTALYPAERVRQVALSVSGVVSVHKIRSRGGARGGHADLHVQLRGELRLDEAHEIGHRVADRLREELGLRDVLVHVEPAVGEGRGR